MRYFLSYKFTDVDQKKLRDLLELVSNEITNDGNASFSFFRDIQKWGTTQTDRDEIIPIALDNLKNSDALLVILDANTKSTGMGIEVGYAVALNKPILVLKRKEVIDDYIESVSESVEEYVNESEIPTKLRNLLYKSSQHSPRKPTTDYYL